MRMMESGEGSGKARAGVFFLALGLALTSGFEKNCGNAVAGGIDLSGMFSRYINIRRGAFIIFMAARICQPWQLVNQATTFLTVISSFSVFLAPMMGIMSCDLFILARSPRGSPAGRPRSALYYLSFFLGFFISAIVFYILNSAFPVPGLGDIDETDVFGTFTPEEAWPRGMAPAENALSSETDSIQKEKI
ncbi:hypothetical protein C8R44DRAFT_978644 [Mycena epipterygia]|nr:hypothetical protein C8R44DRAFT_978644 [Mycena epipterygia]